MCGNLQCACGRAGSPGKIGRAEIVHRSQQTYLVVCSCQHIAFSAARCSTTPTYRATVCHVIRCLPPKDHRQTPEISHVEVWPSYEVARACVQCAYGVTRKTDLLSYICLGSIAPAEELPVMCVPSFQDILTLTQGLPKDQERTLHAT